MMPRSVPEWIGKTDDSAIPKRVKVRVYDRYKGLCHICGLPIKQGETWHCDHVKALIEGGENRESNLKPAHAHCNLAKAGDEKKRKSKVARMKAKDIGADQPKGDIPSRGFQRKKEREPKGAPFAQLPRRTLYR